MTEGWVDYLTGPWGIAFAAAAGVIPFLSPCVLPLVPAYLAHLTGVSSEAEASIPRRETMTHAVAFVLGFGLAFTILGASVGLAGGLLRDHLLLLERIAGVFLIILGLNLMGLLRLPWLYRTYQLGDSLPAARSTPLSYARSLGFGAAFAVAWTPCIGPVLGAILTLAAASSTVYQGAYLLLAYSVGLALPFLAAGYALSSVTALLRRFRPILPILEIGTGTLVVLVGVLVFLDQFTSLNRYFDLFPGLSSV